MSRHIHPGKLIVENCRRGNGFGNRQYEKEKMPYTLERAYSRPANEAGQWPLLLEDLNDLNSTGDRYTTEPREQVIRRCDESFQRSCKRDFDYGATNRQARLVMREKFCPNKQIQPNSNCGHIECAYNHVTGCGFANSSLDGPHYFKGYYNDPTKTTAMAIGSVIYQLRSHLLLCITF